MNQDKQVVFLNIVLVRSISTDR